MRREERRHLKENPLAIAIGDLQQYFATSRRVMLIAGGLIAMAAVAVGGFSVWQQSQSQKAGNLLAEAMAVMSAPVVLPPDPVVNSEAEEGAENEASLDESLPPESFQQPAGSYPSLEAKFKDALPKLMVLAESYPGTEQGITAKYEAAAVLAILGRPDEAAEFYEQVLDVSGDGIYGQMSLLGLAEAYLETGRYQDAVELLEGQVALRESTVPVDAVLMRLGRAYSLSDQLADSISAFKRVADEFPGSVYLASARQEVEALRLLASETSGQ